MARIEIQVLWNQEMLSRPIVADIPVDVPGSDLTDWDARFVHMQPGYAATEITSIDVEVSNLRPYVQAYALCYVRLVIDGNPMGERRPAGVYMRYSDMPSALVNFQPKAAADHPSLGGWHAVTLRCIDNIFKGEW